MKQIGLFGGTFNPIHRGHLWAAKQVRETYGLDSVILIPSAIPPHKHPNGIRPAPQRLDMIRRAAAGQSGLTVSDIELARVGPSYTIDTVRHYISQTAGRAKLFLIVGLDAFLEMDTWRSYRQLFQLISLIVLDRPGSVDRPEGDIFETVLKFLKSRISDEYAPTPDPSVFKHGAHPSVHVCSRTMLDVSSTRIRELVKRGENIDALVPETVDEYIRHKGIYR
ncbi:MAG: nicotinate (nicotinamide) nucleotide adenylyltransferase [Deltaproteobacteria bacterium]|nr:nicotinate (nicotinamide) nucleotide adenylyltransferase [Deltaproteobacteria bacterium]